MKQKQFETVECPACCGSGKLQKDIRMNVNTSKKYAAEILVKNGWPLRAIMHLFGYKSPQSVSHLLHYEHKVKRRTTQKTINRIRENRHGKI